MDDNSNCPPSSTAAAALGLGGVLVAVLGAVGWYSERARADAAEDTLRRAGIAPQSDPIGRLLQEG